MLEAAHLWARNYLVVGQPGIWSTFWRSPSRTVLMAVVHDLDHRPIQLHSGSPWLRYRGCLAGPAHQARGRQRKNMRHHSTAGHPQDTQALRCHPTAVPRGYAHEPRMGPTGSV